MYLKVVQGRLFVWRDVSDAPTIAPGSEVLAINGRSVPEILGRVWAHIPSDGFIETRKPHLINRSGAPTYEGFDLYYMLHVARPQTFRVRYRDRLSGRESELTARGLSFEEKRGRLKELYAEDDRPRRPSDCSRIVGRRSSRYRGRGGRTGIPTWTC